MYLEYAHVKNLLEVHTKYGRQLVMNVKLQDKISRESCCSTSYCGGCGNSIGGSNNKA